MSNPSRKRQASQLEPQLSAHAAIRVRRDGPVSSTEFASRGSPNLDYDSEAGMAVDVPDVEDSSAKGSKATTARLEHTSVPLSRASLVDSETASHWSVHMRKDECLTILGQYRICVLKGVISIYGAYLTAQSPEADVIAPCTEALPVIRCLDIDVDLKIYPRFDGHDATTTGLQCLSPLFQGIWNCGCDKCEKVAGEVGFQILFGPKRIHSRPNTFTLGVPSSWNGVLSKINSDKIKPRRILVCGEERCGKSTIARWLTNSILTAPKSSGDPVQRLYMLDLNNDCPEICLPGHVACINITTPILSPLFAVSERVTNHESARVHHVEPEAGPLYQQHYLNCVSDLVKTFLENQSADSVASAIVCLPGWRDGHNDDDLASLIRVLQPVGITDLVYFGKPPTVLKTALASLGNTSTHELSITPNYPPRKFTMRTKTELRDMTTMSYMHKFSSPLANFTPLSTQRPVALSYRPNKEIEVVGVYIAGEFIPSLPKGLSRLMNGNLVVVAMRNPEYEMEDIEIARGEGDDVPYFVPEFSGSSVPLDPANWTWMGLSIVTNVDIDRGLIMLARGGLRKWSGSGDRKVNIAIIAGSFRMPEWAYCEEYHFLEAGGEIMSNHGLKQPWLAEVSDEESGEEPV